MKLRIVSIFLNPYSRTGGQRRYIELTVDLARRGHDVYLIKNQALFLETPGVQLLEFESKPKNLLPLNITYWNLINKNRRSIVNQIKKADWIMIHGETNLLAGIALSKLLGAGLFYALRSNGIAEAEVYMKLGAGGFIGQLKWQLRKFKHVYFARSTARYAKLVTVQSNFDRDTYLKAAPSAEQKLVIIPGNIGPPRFLSEYKGKNQSTELKKLLYVGSFGLRKGIDFLLEAVRMLIEEGIDIELDILGGGGQVLEIQQFAEKYGIKKRIRTLGRQDNPFPFLIKSDLLVVPSLFDSFPDTVLEALHCGTPVIGTRVGGIPDMIGTSDLLFDAGNAGQIVDLVKKLFNDKESYRKAKAYCSTRAEHFHFDWTGAFEQAMINSR